MSRIEQNNRRPFTVVVSFVLAFALVGLGVLSSVAYAENGATTDKTTEAQSKGNNSSEASSGNGTGTNDASQTSSSSSSGKEEVVYGSLSAAGDVKAIYVVNEFSLDKAGTISDYGKYESLTNLTSTDEISYDGEKVSVESDAGKFYYEGALSSSDLPWSFALNYTLDGKKISVDEIAGQSGNLEIAFTSKQNKKVDSTFYDNYMLQITFTFDSEKFSNIKADGATIANSGKSKTVVYTVMPGTDADYKITARVTDCEMSGVTIAGMPYSTGIDMPDTDSLLGELTTLTDAISSLNEGVGELASGTNTFSDGTGSLVEGSATFKEGLDQLGGYASSITEGSSKINQALELIARSMEGIDDIDLSSFSELSAALYQVSAGLTQMGDELTTLRDGYGAAYDVLDSAIAAIPASEEVDWDILYNGVTDSGVLQELDKAQSYYAAARAVYGTYYGGSGNSGTQAAFLGVTYTLNVLTDSTSQNSLYGTAAALSMMAARIDDAIDSLDFSQLAELSAGLKELSKQYRTFHEGLVQYDEGVSAAAKGYKSLHNGLVALEGGTEDLADGVKELYTGTSQLDEAMKSLPEEMQTQIDELLGDYMPSEFDTLSFVSSKNKEVELVQFVIMSDAIEIPKEEAKAVEEEKESSLWDQFLSLFSQG